MHISGQQLDHVSLSLAGMQRLLNMGTDYASVASIGSKCALNLK